MKTHTSQFKNTIKEFGRELDNKITYTISGTTTELGNEQLNSVSPHYEGAILKSVMKQLDIDSNVEIPVGTEVNYQFGVKTRSGKNVLDFDDFLTTRNAVYTKEDGVYSITNLGSTYGNPYTLDLKPSTTYTISQTYQPQSSTNVRVDILKNGSGLVTCYATNPNILAQTFTTDSSSVYTIRINYSTASSPVLFNKLMIEEGTTPTTYEAYGTHDYVDFGNYIVKDVEKQEDTRSYKITCYDKMLYAMKEYENSNITFPLTIRDYISAICGKIGLTFANASDTFANYDKTIPNELYLDIDGNSLNYTFRDVLDELAQVTASTICINDNDKLEIRYINQTIGKNIFNKDATALYTSNVTYQANNTGIDITTSSLTYGFVLFDLGKLSDFENKTLTVSLSSDYISKLGSTAFVACNDSGGSRTQIGNGLGNNTKLTTTIGSGYSQTRLTLRLYINSATANTTYAINNIQVELNSTATEYEPYGDTIDEEYLKDVNVNFGEKYGPVNTIVLSRGGDGDKISLSNPTNLADVDKIAIQISDNQIMNGNDRNTYMSDILNKLYGLEYYINDFVSTGICYYDLCDKYNVKVGNKFYSCIMFNDSVEVTQGLQESIYTDMQEENEQEYKYMSSTDRGITQANIIANKVDGVITEYTQRLNEDESKINAIETKQTDTERTIDVISTNIDANGNITEVTTTTGFTFNANGMTIHKSDSNFYAIHDETGTFYYDGGTDQSNIVGQYTKEGSKQKDLYLFGVYYYGMDEIDDTPMFVAQLYTDENGNEAVGHFWNRGN